MIQIQITDAQTIPTRPYTLKLSGFIGQNKFYGELEGVNLRIDTPHPLSRKQLGAFEDKVTEIFPHSLNGQYDEEKVNEIISKGPYIFRV